MSTIEERFLLFMNRKVESKSITLTKTPYIKNKKNIYSYTEFQYILSTIIPTHPLFFIFLNQIKEDIIKIENNWGTISISDSIFTFEFLKKHKPLINGKNFI